MILTEEEAKTKRCQESFGDRYLTADGRSFMSSHVNMGASTVLQASPSFCIGTGCMAWRWRAADEGDTKGFCGKAGRPRA